MHKVTSFSSTSSNIAISTSAPELVLVNNATGKPVRSTPVPSLVTHLVASSTLLVSGCADGFLRTHDFRTGKTGEHAEASVKAHANAVQGLDVSGNLVFTIGLGVTFVGFNAM